MFRQGLNSEILRELVCRDDDLTLDQLISISIRLDQLSQDRTGHKKLVKHAMVFIRRGQEASSPSEREEPMVCDFARLSPEERERGSVLVLR